MIKAFENLELWFVTGAQLRYGCSLNGEKSRSENLSACKPMQNQKYINDKSRNPVIH